LKQQPTDGGKCKVIRWTDVKVFWRVTPKYEVQKYAGLKKPTE
jgi:hypothetical protein